MTKKDKIHVLSRAVVLDQEHILLCKTLDLPKPFYFLPGGHVEHGESATETVLRELQEEAGATDCTIKRLLGCLEYSFEPGHSSICHNHEYNFIFKVTSPSLQKQIPLPRLEDHIGGCKSLTQVGYLFYVLQNFQRAIKFQTNSWSII